MLNCVCIILVALTGYESEKYLQSSVKVVVGERISSGTLFSIKDDAVYVISTGHMCLSDSPTIKVFYRNFKKLEKPLEIPSEVLFVCNNHQNGLDFSIMKIKFHDGLVITPLSKHCPINVACFSVGCDMGQDPKSYWVDAKCWKRHNREIWTVHKKNEEILAGRSGGGLFYNGKMIGVCWGRYHGENEIGITDPGMFTSATAIRKVLKTAGFKEILN